MHRERRVRRVINTVSNGENNLQLLCCVKRCSLTPAWNASRIHLFFCCLSMSSFECAEFNKAGDLTACWDDMHLFFCSLIMSSFACRA